MPESALVRRLLHTAVFSGDHRTWQRQWDGAEVAHVFYPPTELAASVLTLLV